jgi:hypothetical protein
MLCEAEIPNRNGMWRGVSANGEDSKVGVGDWLKVAL